ncbi:MAG: DUF6580 family putative transport protein, partial [Bacteroidia bacterium]
MEQTQDKTTRIIILALLIVVAIFSRFLPHPPNFTAVAAVALFAGVHFRNRFIAFAIPLLAMLASDLIIGLHDTLIAVYAAFALTVGIGLWISGKAKAHIIALGAVSASVLFFLITNFAVWMSGFMYPMSFNGLLMCYAAALPFFQNTLAGDLFFTALLFGTYHLVNYK